MPVLQSKLNPRSSEFESNREALGAAVADLRKTFSIVSQGGTEAAREKHIGRGKLLPRERVRTLLDTGSPFLELSQLAAWDMYDGAVPSAGIITGIALLVVLNQIGIELSLWTVGFAHLPVCTAFSRSSTDIQRWPGVASSAAVMPGADDCRRWP